MTEAPKDGLSRILESTIQLSSSSTLVSPFEPLNNTPTLNGKDKKLEKHHGEVQGEGYSQKMSVGFAKQLESEIGVTKAITRRLRRKKRKIRGYICRYTDKHLDSRPRTNVLAEVPPTFNGLDVAAVIHSEHQTLPRVLASSPNFPSPPSEDSSRTLNQRTERSSSVENMYDTQFKFLLTFMTRHTPVSQDFLQRAVLSVLNHDFTSYARSMQSFVLHMNYSYDFVPSNPLLLLASRWAFASRTEQIVRYVARKRRAKRIAAEAQYEEYRSAFEGWKRKKIEPEVEDRAIAVKKVDIYGHESPLILPKPASIQPGSLCLESPLPQRKATLDLDPSTCKLLSEIC
eukprot:TRINITY_DN4105_c0_g3_i2.p2 TRINITY_DN4105_c0_g3~~TRINITY_DN4105_c0_g3_i2.p2  ORF type:complete len:344 (+),score=63.66 TRINITY_DN4105_c0_g3_i2:438-1469(+)